MAPNRLTMSPPIILGFGRGQSRIECDATGDARGRVFWFAAVDIHAVDEFDQLLVGQSRDAAEQLQFALGWILRDADEMQNHVNETG